MARRNDESGLLLVDDALAAIPVTVQRSLRPDHELLSKYQSQVEGHLDRINLQLDEDIAQMRRKLREDKARIEVASEQRGVLEKEISKFEMERLEHDRLYEETQKRVAEQEEKLNRDQLRLQRNKDEAQRNRAIHSDLRVRLDATNEKIVQIQNSLGGDKDRRGAQRGKEIQLERAKEEGQRILTLKNTQDSHIDQLRRDVASADSSLAKIQEEMENEINKYENDRREAENLKERMRAFEAEKTIGEDHFSKLVQSLKSSRQSKIRMQSENLEIRTFRSELDKLRRMVEKKTEYIEELRQSTEETKDRLAKAKSELERVQVATRRSRTTTARMRRQYTSMKREATGYEEEGSSDSELEQLDRAETAASLRTQMLQKRVQELEKMLAAKNDTSGTRGPRPKTSKPSTRPPPSERKAKVDDAKTKNVAAKRRLTAMRMAKQRLENMLEEEEGRLAEKREEVKELAQELNRVENERVDTRGERPLDEVTPETAEAREEKTLEAKKEELEGQRKALELEVRELRQNLDNENEAIIDVRNRLRPYEDIDMSAYEEERKGNAVELRRLKNYHREIMKAIREKQKELSLSVVQRENAVDKARATLNVETSVRSERAREVASVQKRITELEKELDSMGLSHLSNSTIIE